MGLEGAGNLTNSDGIFDDDPDWSPDGQTLVYTWHGVDEPHQDSWTAPVGDGRLLCAAVGGGSLMALP